MSKKEQGILTLSLVLALAFGVPQSAGAMHIAEGYLPAGFCLTWGAVCLPFVAWGLIKIRRLARGQKSVLVILAMAGAFAFVLSALKIPSVSASSSHPTGTGLGAILFGPAPMAVLGLIVLLFQALLLAHGGLTTLGANTFSMAIAGPLVSWGVWRACGALRVNRRISVFLAAALGPWPTPAPPAAWRGRRWNFWGCSPSPRSPWPSSRGWSPQRRCWPWSSAPSPSCGC